MLVRPERRRLHESEADQARERRGADPSRGGEGLARKEFLGSLRGPDDRSVQWCPGRGAHDPSASRRPLGRDRGALLQRLVRLPPFTPWPPWPARRKTVPSRAPRGISTSRLRPPFNVIRRRALWSSSSSVTGSSASMSLPGIVTRTLPRPARPVDRPKSEAKKSLTSPKSSHSADPAGPRSAPGGGVKSIPLFQFAPRASYFPRLSGSLRTS